MNAPLDDPDLPDLISAAMELRDSGVDPCYGELCRDRPDLIEVVRQSVDYSEQLAAIGRSEPRRVLDGRYRLDAQLGAGAMGVVYRGTDKELIRPVAIKILRAAMLGEEEAGSRFAREAEVMAAIRHPAVATVYDRGRTAQGETYLVMELLEGMSLVELLEQAEAVGAYVQTHDTAWVAAAIGCAELDDSSFLRTAVQWTADLADGLQAAHDAGVIHRDIKPSNVFIRRDGHAVLLDFGIASQQNHATITREGGALGTPAYMAPESLDERMRPTPALDVYGLAATLYHLLTLRPPFQGTPSQVLASLARRDPTPAFRLRKGLPNDLQAILDKGMAKKPGGRYRSAAALGADLRAFLAYQPVTARPVSGLTRVLRRARRSPAIVTGVAVAAAALALVIGSQQLDAWHRARERAYLATISHLPANTTLVDYDNRRVDNDDERRATIDVLDRSVDLCARPVPALALRAAFRLDQGDVGGCRRDMRAIADRLGTEYANAVATRFDALPADASSARQVELEGLPQAASAQDVLLAAYLAYRVRDREEATRLLADPRTADSVFAETLRIQLALVAVEKIKAANDRIGPALDILLRIERLEARIGHPTAYTHHLAAGALILQRRFEQALEVAEKGLALAPWSYTTRITAGLAAQRAHRYQDALRILAEARDLRPGYLKPRRTRFYTCIDIGDLDQAASILAAATFDDSDDERRFSEEMHGELEAQHSLRHYREGRKQEAVAAARRATSHFERAIAIKPDSNLTQLVMCQALVDYDRELMAQVLAAIMARDPTNWWPIEQLTLWMSDDLSELETRAVRGYLEALARHLSSNVDER